MELTVNEVSAIDQNATQDLDLTSWTDRRKTILLSTLAFLVSYALTAGPAVFILDKMDLPIAEVVYAPIIMLVKLKIPVISPLIKTYIGLFQ